MSTAVRPTAPPEAEPPSTGSPGGYRKPTKSGRARALSGGRHVVLVVLSLLTLFPLVLMVSTAFKGRQEVKVDPFGLFTSFSFENLAIADNGRSLP